MFEILLAVLAVALLLHTLVEAGEVLLWVGVLLMLAGGARMVWHRWLGRFRAECDGEDRCCWACEAAGPADDLPAGDWDYDGHTDDVWDPIADIFADEVRPVNEPHPLRWERLDGRNRGAWLDHVSREAAAQNGRWISERQQEQAGRALADEAAAFLAAEAARGETTGEIRRGDPGE